MSNRPKLLMVGGFPPPNRNIFGGIVTSCRALLDSSLPQRIELNLIDSTQISNPPPVLPLRFLLAVKRLFVFLFRLETFKPDAVLLFASVGASLFDKGTMARYARLRGIPVLIFPRGGVLMDDFEHSALARWSAHFALSGATKILCQGEQWQDFVTHKLNRQIEDAPVIRNWTASNKLLNVGKNRAKPNPGAPIKLVFVGWLDQEKGILELLVAFGQIAKTRNVILELVGEGNSSMQARHYVQTNGLADRVIFRGWLRGNDLVNAFRDANIFVLPSWAEGFPNALVEAMAARLPVVVTAVGNIPSVIVDGENGLLIPRRNVAALEGALDKVISDVALRDHIADQGYQFVRDHFGVETAVEQLAKVIEMVMRRPVRSVSLPSGIPTGKGGQP